MMEFSIHALLAESDSLHFINSMILMLFYPRSPCGERPWVLMGGSNYDGIFYPRSPCGERLLLIDLVDSPVAFLSTLSLRRATQRQIEFERYSDFSIHALLAESDSTRSQPSKPRHFFLSTLSLRRATLLMWYQCNTVVFSIHALLAESDLPM